jgi:membrane protein
VVAGVCFLLLVSLTLESLLKAFSHYVQSVIPGGLMVAMSVYLIFDFVVILLLFAMSFKFLRDAKIQRRDVWIGAVMTAILFGIDIPAILDGEKINRGRSRNIFYIIGVIVVIVIVLKLLGLF